MTTVITRLYATEKAAEAIRKKLWREGFPDRALELVSGDSATGAALVAKMTKARVSDDAAAAYAKAMKAGNTLLVVRATYKPLGAARITREMTAETETIDVGLESEESSYRDPPEKASSILQGHPHMLTLPMIEDDLPIGNVSEQLGFKTLSPRKEKNSVIRGRRLFLTGRVKARRRKSSSAISGGKHMSQRFWPRPLLSTKPRRKSVIRGNEQFFSRLFGLRLLS